MNFNAGDKVVEQRKDGPQSWLYVRLDSGEWLNTEWHFGARGSSIHLSDDDIMRLARTQDNDDYWLIRRNGEDLRKPILLKGTET